MLSHHFDIIDFFLSLLTLAGGEILRQIRILNIMCFFAIVECIHVMSHIVKSVKEVNRYIYTVRLPRGNYLQRPFWSIFNFKNKLLRRWFSYTKMVISLFTQFKFAFNIYCS